jgi:two-component system, chemotaxis family, protein-glutamate methylesterase/glutaminase
MSTEVPRRTDPTRKAVALVGSAGGLIAASTVLAALPAVLGAPLIVLLHLDPNHVSRLAAILARTTELPVKQAESGDALVDDRIFVAPPASHLLVTADGALELGSGPPVRRLRPSADVFLTSLAVAYGTGALAVILSGAGHDGAAGAAAVKLAGGLVIAQDRESADHFGMPSAAIEEGAADRVLPVGQVAAAVLEFVQA